MLANSQDDIAVSHLGNAEVTSSAAGPMHECKARCCLHQSGEDPCAALQAEISSTLIDQSYRSACTLEVAVRVLPLHVVLMAAFCGDCCHTSITELIVLRNVNSVFGTIVAH